MNRENMDKPQRIYFYATCLVDLFYPSAGLAGIKLIEREGVAVEFLQDQTCCGQPAYNSGYWNEARAVARKQIEMFSGDYPVVVPSGSCAAMMKHQYPKLFEGDEFQAKAIEFSNRVFELTEFLVVSLNIKLTDLGSPAKVALHSSCHARREMQVAHYAEQLVSQLSNIEIVEQDRKAECCGFGGTFSVKQPEISAAMVEDKSASLEQSGADKVVSGDCGCLMNISGALEHKQSALKGHHIASFIWDRINHES